MCFIGNLFHLIQFDPFWIKGQEVTQLFKFPKIGKGENKNIYLIEKFCWISRYSSLLFLVPPEKKNQQNNLGIG